MDKDYLYHADLAELVSVAPDSIVSRSLVIDDRARITLFAFDTGQELTEHTSSRPAILHFLKGEADLTLGSDKMTAHEGTWAYMQPNLAHSIVARTPLVMLLTMFEK